MNAIVRAVSERADEHNAVEKKSHRGERGQREMNVDGHTILFFFIVGFNHCVALGRCSHAGHLETG